MIVKVGSLFDGIGGTPLSAAMCGAKCLWASEIEKFPIQVTEYRFPDMKHYGDITKINGAEIEPVDIIVGGSPCQDLSVAGKRAGMKHGELGHEETTRSGLFMEQIRIVKEMRDADKLRNTDAICPSCGGGSSANPSERITQHGFCSNCGGTNETRANQPVRPRFMVWENVPGAFSSNSGEDFRVVLEETARVIEAGVVIPRPPKGKWKNAGSIMGDGWSIAWRVFDAQHWGVPQRRRRIYLVADFGGQSAPQILFEREGLFGDSSESQDKGQGATGVVESGVGTTILDMTHANDVTRECGDVVPTLQNRMGTGGNQVPLVMAQYWDGGQVVGTLSTRNANGAQRMPDKQHFQGIIQNKAVRRLTPLECERLQGYPDSWTDIPGASDSARYKALGNSFAVPNIYNVLKGCVEVIVK